MKRFLNLLALGGLAVGALSLGSANAFAQAPSSQTLHVGNLEINDGAGHTLVLQMPTSLVSGTFSFPDPGTVNPGAVMLTSDYSPAWSATANNQTFTGFKFAPTITGAGGPWTGVTQRGVSITLTTPGAGLSAPTTNIGGLFSASGATNNYGLLVTNGNVGIGNAAPTSLLSVGATEQFKVTSTGNMVVGGSGTAAGDVQATSIRSNGVNSVSWSGMGAFGGTTATAVLGELNSKATIGGHDNTLFTWSDLYIQPAGAQTRVGSAVAPTKTLDVGGTFGVSGISSFAANVSITPFTTAGVVHNSAAGLLSSSAVNLASNGAGGDVTGTLAVSNGGTGAATLTSNGVLLGNGTGAVSAAPVSTVNGQFLQATTAGIAPTWKTILSEANGGTNQSTYATGNILYAVAANTLTKLPIGIAGDFLTVAVGGVPAWDNGAGNFIQNQTLGVQSPANFSIAGQGTIALTSTGNAGPYSALTVTSTNTNAATPGTTTAIGINASATVTNGADDEAIGGLFTATGALSAPAVGARFSATGGLTNTAIDVTAGNVHLTPLTASYAVVTDASKNLASLQYTSAGTASTLVSRDGTGGITGGTLTATTAASGLVLGSGANATTLSSSASVARAISFPDAPGTLALTSGVVNSISGTLNRIAISGTTTVPIVDIASTYVGQTSITTLGTIGTGTWQGTLVGPTYGGTGVNNGTNTLTLGGNLTTAGAFNTTLTATALTSVTLPTSGTLATTANINTAVSGTANSLAKFTGANTVGNADLTGDVTTTGTTATTIATTAGTNIRAALNTGVGGTAINAAAGGTGSIAVPTSGQILIGNAGGTAYAANSVSGDVTISNAGVTAIGSGVIVDADINAAAAISYSKLAALATGQVLLGNAGVPTATTLSGDAAVSNLGVVTVSKFGGTTFGTMAGQNATAVAITGGTGAFTNSATNTAPLSATNTFVNALAGNAQAGSFSSTGAGAGENTALTLTASGSTGTNTALNIVGGGIKGAGANSFAQRATITGDAVNSNFAITNTKVVAGSVIVLTVEKSSTAAYYSYWIESQTAGSFTLHLSAVPANLETVKVNYIVIN